MGDSLTATRGQELVEVSHRVDVTIEEGTSTMVVRRTFENRGKRTDEASLRIQLPPGAAVTGLRIKAGKVWHAGDLMEREKAAALYRELTGIGPHAPKDPALLFWVWADRVHLRVFPLLAGKRSTVEYTLTVPTDYENGRYSVSYPRPTAGLATPKVRLRPPAKSPAADVAIDGVRVPGWKWISLAAAGENVEYRGHGRPSENASYIASDLQLRGSGDAKKANVDVDIVHTYRGDLSVDLVTPTGDRLPLARRKGGGDNDVKERFSVDLPAATPVTGTWSLSVSDHAGLDVGTLRRWKLEVSSGGDAKVAGTNRTKRVIPDAPGADTAEFATLQTGAPQIWPAAARLGAVELKNNQGVGRVEIDVAPKLSKLPRDLSVVFVLDASRSMTDIEVEGQLDLVRAYLHYVPKARFEIVLTSRFASRLNGRFVAATQIDTVLAAAGDAGRMRRRNGSAIEQGLESAVDALSKRRGTRRIVVFSDGRLRTTFRLETAVGQVARGRDATTHLLIAESRGSWNGLERNDEHPLAAVAVSSGGILTRYRTPAKQDLKRVTDDALGLVRPVKLEHFMVQGLSDDQSRDVPQVLHEGSGFRTMALTDGAPIAKSVTLQGVLWSRPVELVVKAGGRFGKKTAAWVFPADMHGDLTREQQLELAFFGNVVSPVTSFLAIEPGVRPSVDGLEQMGSGMGLGSARGLRLRSGHAVGSRFDLSAELHASALPCKNANPPPAQWTLVLAVETTSDEIVDVIVVPRNEAHDAPSTRQSGLSKLDQCVIEAVWDYEIPDGAMTRSRHAQQITFN